MTALPPDGRDAENTRFAELARILARGYVRWRCAQEEARSPEDQLALSPQPEAPCPDRPITPDREEHAA